MDVQHFFDKDTSSLTYIVYDAKTRDAVIIDPVLDFNQASGRIETHGFKKITEFVEMHKLKPVYCIETHAHADHLSSSQLMKENFPGIKIAISSNIIHVQKAFKDILKMDPDFKIDGSQFDKLIKDHEDFSAGSIRIHAIPTPGHTPACMSFHINNMLFCGDSLFIEDYGTGRCDFPDGSADRLYTSVHETLYKLPNDTIVFVGHDYRPNGRELRFETTIGASKKFNAHLKEETKREDFIHFREARDKTLTAPRLLNQSIKVNIGAGEVPKEFKN
ncbi:MAG: MBL fold metallo-hydrolase [Bacteriovorax sp.]|nr:MBL fold metallo-hydrolase [Bacteriovorax sp.]